MRCAELSDLSGGFRQHVVGSSWRNGDLRFAWRETLTGQAVPARKRGPSGFFGVGDESDGRMVRYLRRDPNDVNR